MMKILKAGMACLLVLTSITAQAVTESFIQGKFARAAEGSTDWHASYPDRIIPVSTGYLVIGNNEVQSNATGYLTTGTTLYALKLTANMERDISFGPSGVQALDVPAGYYYRNTNVYPLPSGKFLVAAEADMISPPEGTWREHILLARFNADASPDTSFGAAGSVLVNMPCIDESSADAPSLGVQADGKIVLAGTFGCPTTGRMGFVSRFSASGVQEDLDGAAASGLLLINPRSTSTWLTLSTIDSEGRLIVAGESNRPSADIHDWSFDTFVARITLGATPQLDTTFNGTGFRIIEAANADDSWATSVVAEGTKVTVSSGIDSATGGAMITRLLATGAPDTTFGTAGAVLVTAGAYNASIVRQIVPTTSGYYLLGALNNRRALVKLTASGALDTGDANFAGTGYWRSGISNASVFVSALLHEGKLLAAGFTITATGESIEPQNELESTDFVISSFPLSDAPAGGSVTVVESSSSSSGGGSADFIGMMLLAVLVLVRRRQLQR